MRLNGFPLCRDCAGLTIFWLGFCRSDWAARGVFRRGNAHARKRPGIYRARSPRRYRPGSAQRPGSKIPTTFVSVRSELSRERIGRPGKPNLFPKRRARSSCRYAPEHRNLSFAGHLLILPKWWVPPHRQGPQLLALGVHGFTNGIPALPPPCLESDLGVGFHVVVPRRMSWKPIIRGDKNDIVAVGEVCQGRDPRFASLRSTCVQKNDWGDRQRCQSPVSPPIKRRFDAGHNVLQVPRGAPHANVGLGSGSSETRYRRWRSSFVFGWHRHGRSIASRLGTSPDAAGCVVWSR